jgi:hypothetical protein
MHIDICFSSDGNYLIAAYLNGGASHVAIFRVGKEALTLTAVTGGWDVAQFALQTGGLLVDSLIGTPAGLVTASAVKNTVASADGHAQVQEILIQVYPIGEGQLGKMLQQLTVRLPVSKDASLSGPVGGRDFSVHLRAESSAAKYLIVSHK